jgi:hypothetical protein
MKKRMRVGMKQEQRKLSDKQVALLELVLKFRFGTREYIGNSLGISSGSSLHERLELLSTHGYLGKRKDPRSQALNKPVVYYVAPKGIRALQVLPGHQHIGEQELRLSYQNKATVSDGFVAHTLNLFELTLCLSRQYPNLKAFTSRETAHYTYFPEEPPDRFLSLPDDTIGQSHRYFLDIVRDRQSRRILEHRLQSYIEFFDDGDWEETGSPVPVLLLVSEWAPSERSIQRFVRKLLEKADADLRIYTATADAVLGATDNLAIWTAVEDTDEHVSLTDIPVNP